MEQKPGKCWKLQLLQAKLQVFISYLSEMKTVCSIILLYSSTFYILFLTFFILEIFKFFKYDKFYVRHSASISNLKDVNSSVVRFIHSSFGRKWPNYKTSNNFWKFPTFLYEIKGFQCFIQCKFELNELSVPKLVPCVLPWILKIWVSYTTEEICCLWGTCFLELSYLWLIRLWKKNFAKTLGKYILSITGSSFCIK